MDANGSKGWQQPIFSHGFTPIDRKIHALYTKSFKRWSGVTRWSVFGPLCALGATWAITWLAFWGTEQSLETWSRVAVAATLGPLIISLPLFYAFTVQMRRLAIENLRLTRVANIDSLTGCLNRGAFTALTDKMLTERQLADGGALLVIDADNFKAINDRYGHDQGDVALGLIAATLRNIVRTSALVGRIGGEEFAVYMPGASRLSAYPTAERIRRGIRRAPFAPHGVPHQLSVSIGGASFAGPVTFTELFRSADQGLYAAKKSGRNAVEVAAISLPPPIVLRSA